MRYLQTTSVFLLGTVFVIACGGGTPVRPSPAQPSPPPLATNTDIYGFVKEAQRGPLAGVGVTSDSDAATVTDALGRFSLSVPGCQARHVVSFAKPGYRTYTLLRAPCREGRFDVTLQPLMVMTPNSQRAATLFTDDEGYRTSALDFCFPCKLITVRVDRPAIVDVQVRSTGTTALTLWTSTQFGQQVRHVAAGARISDISVDVDMSPSADNELFIGRFVEDDDTPIAQLPQNVPFEVTVTARQ